MRTFALAAAATLATAGGLAAAPAQAQYYGGYDRGYDRGWDRGDHRGWDRGHHRGWDRRWRDERRWRGNRGWRGNGWGDRGRGRVECRVVRGYYGPQRQCYRVWR